MHLFHIPDLAPPHLDLPEEEARHATGVLRLRVGDRVGLLDGRGTRAEAVIVEAGRGTCRVDILERHQHPPERRAAIHLAVAPTKQMDRFEWFLEKATEIGVDRITPLLTERTERSHLRHDRLLKVLVAAMKQSQRAWLPVLAHPTPLNEMVASTAGKRYFGWCTGERASFTQAYHPDSATLMLIGPEGDFTPAEAQSLIAADVAPVSLGHARLRTETAAVVACTWMNMAQEG
ncbi:MAG: 16S rRNA (uracil(1498)-N(3))-methyltransferase [Flavobacteriales bacterium]|nr:16S rRNA (uracil(1498)-N(3))-methyltransferase [Flavobacteriales bacterium]